MSRRDVERGAVWKLLGAPTDQLGSVNDPRTQEEHGLRWNEKWIYLGEDGESIERIVLWNRYDFVGRALSVQVSSTLDSSASANIYFLIYLDNDDYIIAKHDDGDMHYGTVLNDDSRECVMQRKIGPMAMLPGVFAACLAAGALTACNEDASDKGGGSEGDSAGEGDTDGNDPDSQCLSNERFFENEILRVLLQHAGDVVSRNTLLDEVWGIDAHPTSRAVDNHILNLRRKIEADPHSPRYLLTAHRVGYRLVLDPVDPTR